jgi:hypothetical protein
MAHVWVRAKMDEGLAWATIPLEDEAFALTGDATAPLRLRKRSPGSERVLVLRASANGKEQWVLVSAGKSHEIRINGTPLLAGMRVLRNRDEILFNGERMFFSTERLARVVPFPGAGKPVFCARCKTEIAEGSPAVRCPNPKCGVWHHQAPEHELPCWTYNDVCAMCDQPTDLDVGFRWSPEGL